MTEALSLATSAPAHRRSTPTASDLTSYPLNPPASILQEETADDDDGEIACICAINEDDGNTIQCDKCLRWQHISCYYPHPKEVPGEDQKHYCTDCVPQPDLDSRRATERQRKLLDQRNGVNGVKRPAAKKKKVKDSPSLSAQPNGWPERHSHLQNHDRKSASPRDQPPPSKKPKTAHRSTNSISNPSTRKRSAAANAHLARSPSKTPDLDLDNHSFIPQYSDAFFQLYHPDPPQVETDTNILNGLATTDMLTSWLMDPDAVPAVTNGLTQADIFKRWDGRLEDIPGQPEVDVDWVEDPSFANDDGVHPGWARLIIPAPIADGTLIGELRGPVGLKDEYVRETDGRWGLLHHPEPFVFFHPSLPIFIDARHKGTKFRFVRRSCQPNAELQTIITDSTQYHFCFMATRDIMAGEEITVGWQVPEALRNRIHSNLALSTNMDPQIREYFTTWVSTILSNCGPCACSVLGDPSGCLMARYDRRGKPPTQRQAKTNRKKKVASLETGLLSRSRSTSEAPKTEHDDNMTDSRSVSASRASLSRDHTPTAHAQTSGFHQELSERERKKLMREEEMFKRQEKEVGRQKKKRNSGGSNLSTPTASAARISPLEVQKRPRADNSEPKLVNGAPKFADSGPLSRPQISSRTSSGKRKATASSKLSRKSSDSNTQRKPTYIDAAVQCDLGDEPLYPMSVRKPKRLVTVLEHIFNRCIYPQMKMRAEQEAIDAMEVDSDGRSGSIPNGEPTTTTSINGAPKENGDIVMTDAQDDKIVPAEAPLQPGTSAAPEDALSTQEATLTELLDANNAITNDQNGLSAEDSQSVPLPMDLPLDPAPAAAHAPMHLDMPPPPLSIIATQQQPAVMQSPGLITPGSAALLSPSVTSVVSPSPIRKKLSLSDYTKRSKARETPTEERTPSGLMKEIKEGQEDSPVSATAVTPTRDEGLKPVPEEAIVEDSAKAEDTETKPNAGDSVKENIPVSGPPPALDTVIAADGAAAAE